MTIKVAVIGLGKMGLSHLAMINALEGFEVVAICDSSALVGGVIVLGGILVQIGDPGRILGRAYGRA